MWEPHLSSMIGAGKSCSIGVNDILAVKAKEGWSNDNCSLLFECDGLRTHLT